MPDAVIICPESPYPVRGGGPLRTASLLEYLRARYNIDLLIFIQPGEQNPAHHIPAGLARRICVVQLPAHSRTFAARAVRNLGRIIRGVPPLIDRFSGFSHQVTAFLGQRHYDLAILEHFWVAPYRSLVRADRTVLNVHNVESALLQTCASAEREPAAALLRRFAQQCRRLERQWMPRFDCLLAASENDAAAIREYAPVLVYPNAAPLVPEPATAKRHEIAFSGNLDYLPNRTAIQWFYCDIWPRLRSRHPELRWRLIGKNHHSFLSWTAADPRIEFSGPVEDAVHELAQAAIAVAPLRSGSGTRLKIVEAWAAGLPVVSTTLGAEGLAPAAVLADSPGQFADSITRLLESPDERERIGRLGRQLYEQRYSWPAVWRILEASGF